MGGKKACMHVIQPQTPMQKQSSSPYEHIWEYKFLKIQVAWNLSLSLSLHCISMEVASKLALEQEDKLGLNISKKAFKLAYTLYLCSYLLNLI